MTDGGPYDIFVSYARDDYARVARIIESLKRLAHPDSLKIFVDRSGIPNGEDYKDVLRHEVGRSTVVLGVISAISVTRKYVAWECGVGRSRNVDVLIGIGAKPTYSQWRDDWYDGARTAQRTDLSNPAQDYEEYGFPKLLRELGGRQRLDRPDLIEIADRLEQEAREKRDRTDPTKWKDGITDGKYVVGHTRAGTVFRDAPDMPSFVVVPMGSFRFGPSAGERGAVAHVEGDRQRTIKITRPFAVSQHLLTFAEWDFALDKGLNPAESYRPPSTGLERDSYPALRLSWDDAQLYCDWASRFTGRKHRLLSETEWEYCCRAGSDTTRFSFGDMLARTQANYGRTKVRGGPAPVTQLASFDSNAFDIYDMHGNLWEWVQDPWRRGNEGVPVDGRPRAGSSALRVVRGGCWGNKMVHLRSASRGFWDQSDRDHRIIGVRIAREI